MKKTKEEIRELFEKNGYFIDDYALSKAYLSLFYLTSNQSVGQEVYSLCLDGPSGCGKTSFVEAYTKVASELLGKPVSFINFQLDAETGKSDLYEDVDVVATFENDTSKIRIPGTILKAIKLVNEGNYVILKMDEYDKARDSTDTFFNNFLQEGIVNTIQHGDVRIKPENFGKIQVFLCKNDMRVDLSEPMMRRNRIIRLDYMTPELLFKILQNFTNKNNLDSGLLNLVILIYREIYANREIYTKLPSCSECQQAIMDAYLLLKSGGFTKKEIYNNVIENLLKLTDDVKSFESSLSKSKNTGLKTLINDMKKETEVVENPTSINDMIANNVLKDVTKELRNKASEMQKLIDKYTDRFAELEERRQATIEEENKKIALANGSLVATSLVPNIIRNYNDETKHIKRGYDVFQTSSTGWTDVGSVYFSSLQHSTFINSLIKHCIELDIKVYENGFIIKEDADEKLIVVTDKDDEGIIRYRFMSSYPVIPSTYIQDIKNFINFGKSVCENTNNLEKDNSIPSYSYNFNCLVHNDEPLKLKNNDEEIPFDGSSENVYNFYINGDETMDVLNSLMPISSDPTKACKVSQEIINSTKKVKTYE